MSISAKEIKSRIRSMESAKQITKAMETVAASKLGKVQSRLFAARPYFQTLRQTAEDIAASGCLQSRPVNKSVYIVIFGDRGLAGGYNSNILKTAQAAMENKNAILFPIGKKAAAFLNHPTEYNAERMTHNDCLAVAKALCEQYFAGEVDEIFLAYTEYVSVLSQLPRVIRILPLPQPQKEIYDGAMIYEPDRETVFRVFLPEYVGGMLYCALCESYAAEQAARRMAMDSAARNADEMIENLRTQFNRNRQAAITGQIIDIVAGL